MTEKIIIGIADATTGENVTQELIGAELTAFNADRAKFDSIVQNREIELNTKREAVKTKLNALGLSDEDLILLGLIPKPADEAKIK
jgi:hypothetical protein